MTTTKRSRRRRAASGGGRGRRGNAVGLGLLVLDQVFEVEAFVDGATRTRYRSHLVGPGGMASNAMAQAAALGVRSELLTAVGDDPDGRQLLAWLRQAGVSVRRVHRSSEHPTTTAAVLVEHGSGERRFVIPDRRRIAPAVPDFDLRGIGRDTVLLVDGHYAKQAERAVLRARECGARVVGDLWDARPSNLRLLSRLDYPVMPEEFVESWGVGGPRETLRALQRLGAILPVVTLGERGCIALEGDRFHEIPARKVKVRDTTGAGDAFHGAFVAGLVKGMPATKALVLATRVAGECCRKLGALGNLR